MTATELRSARHGSIAYRFSSGAVRGPAKVASSTSEILHTILDGVAAQRTKSTNNRSAVNSRLAACKTLSMSDFWVAEKASLRPTPTRMTPNIAPERLFELVRLGAQARLLASLETSVVANR